MTYARLSGPASTRGFSPLSAAIASASVSMRSVAPEKAGSRGRRWLAVTSTGISASCRTKAMRSAGYEGSSGT